MTEEKTDFNIEPHLVETADKYCEGMNEEEKKPLLNRITCEEGNKGINGRKIYREPALAVTKEQFLKVLDEMTAEGKLLPETDEFQKESVNKVNKIIEDFTGNDSLVSKDLKAILNDRNTNVIIGIRKWGRINASATLIKKENENEKNTVVFLVAEEMFKESPYNEALPGLLAHECGHILEFYNRPKGCETEFMDGAETTADVIGTQLAVNAGYDSRGFGNFMGKDFEDTGIVYDKTPNGDFRRETINLAYEKMTAVKQRRTRDTSQKMTARKIKELQGLSSPKKTGKIQKKSQITSKTLPNLNNIRNSPQR